MERKARAERKTKETSVEISLLLDHGKSEISTGIGFFDHMLEAFAFHAGFCLSVKASGDIHVDGHHTVEDVGIVLGQVLLEALGDKKGIERFAHAYVPMDEALGFAAADVGGRSYLSFDSVMPQEIIGNYDPCLTQEFFRAFCDNAKITLHLRGTGQNCHHINESLFKAAGRALGRACAVTGTETMSTKGVL